MPFSVTQRTLEQLDWLAIVDLLAGHTATPGGRARCGGDAGSLFEAGAEGVRERLAETAEARRILDQGDLPPLGGMRELGPALRRLAKGGVLSGRELRDLHATLGALHETARFLRARREETPRLAGLADLVADLRELEEDVDWAIAPEGEVRDSASPALAAAREQSHRLAGELKRRLDALLHEPDVAACLSDAFVTLRNDRYVLPVRADARGRVRGIVHDASGSGTTVFIEPEAVVELNNHLKQAELDVERETLRVLRQLSGQCAAALPAIETGLAALEAADLAFARAHLSREMEAVEPQVGREGVFLLPQLRHPLLPPDRVVPNDVRLGDGARVLVLSGPNAGGKTVTMKAVALAALFVRAGLFVPAAPGARVDLVDALLADIGDEQSVRESLSTFSAHVANLARILEAASEHSLVVLDEVGVGTDPGEGAALAQALLEHLADRGARVIATTHFNLLKEMAEVDPRFANASVEFDPESLAPTYRLRLGVAGASSATAVAARMGLRPDVIERARALLDREDRRLDRMLVELAASRAALEAERREALRLRAESEAARAEYRVRLERLQERRDQLFAKMRTGLERAFREAHTEVANVIRDLQRGGASARDAARARQRLLALAEHQRQAEAAAAPAAEEPAGPPLDWGRAQPGDPVRVLGAGQGALLSRPDRQGRVAVRVGSARLVVPAARVVAAAPAAPAGAPGRQPPRITVEPAEGDGREASEAVSVGAAGFGSERCDLRGLRVEEALGRVALALDRAARAGRSRVAFLHGLGTGALRDAVRDHLRSSSYVVRFEAGGPLEGGEGVTVAILDEG